MDFLALSLLLLLSFLLLFFHVLASNYGFGRKSTRLPPGPFPIPIIGNILQLSRNPHRSLAKLSETYGPLMHLKLGSIQTIVVSSPEMAKEILQKHDLICSSRAVPCTARALNHHEASLGWLPVGSKWRMFRKICKEHMFTTHKLEASKNLRQEKLQKLCTYLEECCSGGRVVNIANVAFVTSLNLISGTLFSMDFASFDSSSAQEMKETIQGLMKILGTPNIADYFPIFKFLDPQSLARKSKVYQRKLLAIFDEIIGKRLQSLDSPKKDDLLQVLLDINQDNDYHDLSLHDIKNLLMDLIVAGVDTTTDSVQWAMAELLRNPKKMLKVKNELRIVVPENKQIEESDIPKLSYLNAVIKETFRCHPPGPFLIPHKAEEGVEINGYIVPKNAQILVNVWAIGKDSRIWSDPNSFEPERFLDNKVDYKGQDFEFIPFGSGRRICPGMPLAHVMVHLTLAYLIHNFCWKLEARLKPEELNMNEIFGLSLHKAVPLEAFPIKQ